MRLLHYLTLIFFVLLCQWIAFSLNKSPLLHVNALVISLLICSIIFRWPKESWLGAEHAQRCKESHGQSPVGRHVKASDTVKTLSNLKNIDSYYESCFGQSHARATAADVNSALIGRFFIYMFIAALIGVYSNQSQITAFDFATSTMAIFAPFLWDLSRCDKIRNINIKLS